MSLAVDPSMRELLTEHPKDLSSRIHFLGATGDAEFLSGMAICDAVVFPYLEVGQSSSGPISQALAKLHGGRMDLHSTKGIGTRVAIDLPAWPLSQRPGSEHGTGATR